MEKFRPTILRNEIYRKDAIKGSGPNYNNFVTVKERELGSIET